MLFLINTEPNPHTEGAQNLHSLSFLRDYLAVSHLGKAFTGFN